MTGQSASTFPANLTGLDYRKEAERLGPPPVPIIDVHAHINGGDAAHIYREVCDLYGVACTYSMSQLGEADPVKSVLGDRIRYIAVPNFLAADKYHAHTEGFIENISAWHSYGSRMCKFWTAPRALDYAESMGDRSLFDLNGPWRRKQMDHAVSLGMMLMVHIADPDTWFATRYADSERYGTKASQYETLEMLMETYDCPWMLAHMGGWPEDLDFLTGLLDRHPRTCLDTSATKWMVRELSKHPRDEFVAFLERFQGRILFGSDIVSTNLHLTDEDDEYGSGGQAATEDQAFDLYASRYWALRTLFETDYDGPSPIADPDLAMVDPDAHTPMDSPTLRGKSVNADLLKTIYRGAAENIIDAWHKANA